MYRIDIELLTVIYTDQHGEQHDMNSAGDPCETLAELAEYVRELAMQGAYGDDVERNLLAALSEV